MRADEILWPVIRAASSAAQPCSVGKRDGTTLPEDCAARLTGIVDLGGKCESLEAAYGLWKALASDLQDCCAGI